MADWRHKLLKWYESNKRELPWRNINDPYKIWLSEVILQQTRVNQGWEYYLRFIEKYPTVKDLASATESDVLKLWQGLGYYSRARNSHAAAQQIMKVHYGKFPNDFESIKTLKGVGEYTAGAIASIAFNLPYPAVDGNVMRVYSRLLGIMLPINSTEGKKEINKAAYELLLKKNPGTYNQAVMELGAMICLPANPACHNCPVHYACYAYSHEMTDTLPVKQSKTKQRDRYLSYLVISRGNKILLKHRKENDIWKGLYDFPCAEEKTLLSPYALTKTKLWKTLFGNAKPLIESVSNEFIHILSHQKLHAKFIKIKMDKPLSHLPKDCLWINKKDMGKYAISRLIERYVYP